MNFMSHVAVAAANYCTATLGGTAARNAAVIARIVEVTSAVNWAWHVPCAIGCK